MASLGYYLLLAAFVVGAYATAISVAGARRRSSPMIESGVGAFYLLAAIMTAASAVIVYAFVTGDYSIRYVQRYSDNGQPLFYKLTSYWGGLDGSIMFWVFLLSLFGSAAIYINRERHRELIPYVVAIIATVEMFFLLLMVVHNNPFDTYLTESPADGAGLNPLLQNFYMVIHPPTMYLGFVGLTIPYAFGMAALITGYLDDSWLRAVRRWTMVSWLFLSIGLGLGMIWAYEELGWGGYWMWDPVENAGLLPWFTATAFLHSVMVQERRGMLRVWNVSLVIMTFFLTLFGTFMTRSGIVQSVHSFGQDPVLSKLFSIFMISMLVFSFGWVIYRMPLLRARNELDSWLSREAAFLFNNWILLFCAGFVLFATMFPTLSEAITGERITVGPPFFNQWMIPIGLTLLVLTGVGPLLAWRKSTLINLRDSFLFPTLSGLVIGGVTVALGVRIWSAGLCFAFSGFVDGHHNPGVLARRACPSANHWHRHLYRGGRSGRTQQASLRWLHHPRRDRSSLPRVRRQRIQAGRERADDARARGEDRRLRHPAQLAGSHRRWPEADDHGRHDHSEERRRDREDVSGALVLPQARGSADDGSRDSTDVRRGSLHRDAAVRREPAVGQRRDHGQSAGELGLARLRSSRVRDVHRPSA